MPMLDMPLEQLHQYTGRAPKPADFDAYWSDALQELDNTPPNPSLTPAAFSAQGVECFDLTFTGVGGAQIYAKYLRPISPDPHPCVLQFHGYTMDSGDWVSKLPYLQQGMCVAAMDCRGQGGKSVDVGGTTGNTQRGHIIRGLQDGAKMLLYRHIFLDTVQLLRVVANFAEVDNTRIGTMGESQGGALSVACSALSGAVKRSVVQFPFLSDYKRIWEMDLGGNAYQELYDYFRRFDPYHEHEDAFFETLGYIDVRFFAQHIQNPVLMATGLVDKTCPPSTQFAVYNALHCKKELCLYKDFGHEFLPGFADKAFAFLTEL